MQQTQSKPAELVIRGLPQNILSELNDFIKSIKDIQYFKPKGHPNEKWENVFYGSTLAKARLKAMNEACEERSKKRATSIRDEALAAVERVGCPEERSAAMRIAADEVMAKVWGAIKSAAARDAVKFAIRDTDWSAPSDRDWNAKKDVVDDMVLTAKLIILKDRLSNADKYLEHMKERIKAIKGGNGVAADVDGVLYVYCVGNPPVRTTPASVN